MKPFKNLAWCASLIGIVTLCTWGCGQLTTAPEPPAFGAAGATSSTQSAGLISTVGSVVDGVVGLIVRTLNLVGSIGGSLSNGRWRVTIPAGAVDGNATVSLGVKTLTSADCVLSISPADKNHFSVPVTLTIDCRGISQAQLSTFVIAWRDPATGKWVPVSGSKVDLTTMTVSAPLQHFSQYAAGPPSKFGW